MKRIFALVGLLWAAAAAHAESPPLCTDDQNFQQLGYLVGHWDVYNTKGEKAAEVTWQWEFKSCGLQETWQALLPAGQSGMGLMTYSTLRGTPTYYYVGDRAINTLSDQAEVKPNDLTFLVHFPSPIGHGLRTRHFRLALQPDGTILESSTASEDGGPFKPEFEMTWKRHTK